ncbi:MAG TPA: NnrU family protein [Burkholderiaceae bacterium]|nr:NnrU family protein [Burkholderiaceae bacterium]
MTALVIGLLLFLGLHSTRMIADGVRSRFIAQRGERVWRGLYSLGSAIGFVLIIWGFAIARRSPVVLWSPPDWTRPLASLLTLASIVLISAAYVPRNHFKAWVGHPMVLGVKVWAFAHLLATRTLADLLLFGGFLLWSIWCFRSLRARDRAAGRQPTPGQAVPTVVTIAVGAVLWFVFAYWLHGWLIGVRPLG